MGRFITEDPVKDGVNWHVYVSNNPLTMIDPTGLYGLNSDGYSSGPRDGAREWDPERNKKEKELENKSKELKKLENKKGIRANNDRENLREEILAGILDYQSAGYGTDWLKENTELVITRGIYGTPGKDYWDGRLDINFMGASIFDTEIQTWADWNPEELGPNQGTLKLGSYSGTLYSVSKSKNYVDYISIKGAFFIHPNAYNGKEGDRYTDGKPWWNGEKPRSQGCNIPQLSAFNKMNDILGTLGFMHQKGWGEKQDTINITIQLSKQLQGRHKFYREMNPDFPNQPYTPNEWKHIEGWQ